MEAKEIKEFWWKPYIRKLFDKKVCDAHSVTGAYQLICHCFWLPVMQYDSRP